MTAEQGRLQRWRSRLARSRVAFVVWVLVVAVAFVSIAFRATADLGPGTIQARFRPALDGSTVLAVPPLGSVTADTHRAPVQLRFELREVDLLGALGPDHEPGIEGIESEVYDDIGGAVRRLVLLLALAAAAGGVLAAATFPGRRSLVRLASGVLLGPAGVALLVGPAAIGYDPMRFEKEAELAGPLRTAPELLQQVGSLQTRFGSVESRARVLAERVAGLYSATVTGQIERSEGEVVLLHVSDLHLNAVGLSLAQELARNFRVDAVVDTGDITSFGFPPEAGFVELLDGFEVPYYVVPGNHDSLPVRRQLAASDSVHYLDGEAVDIGGVKVLGIGDPTVTALRTIPTETIERTYRGQFSQTRRLIRETQPDLLLVHNPVQAEPALGHVQAIAAGHIHRSRLEVVDGSVVAIVGSSGAAGLENLLVDEGAPYRFEFLRFVDGKLVAVDQVELSGADGDFVLHRRLISDDEAETDREALTEQVQEPSLEDVGRDELERLSTTTTTTPGASTTAPSGGSDDGATPSTSSTSSTSQPPGG